ncbi:MAG TPA: hypothetical protein VD913_00995 [bacterium]|nr:hypothetical protein [bacterium]
MENKKKMLLAASVAGLLAVTGFIGTTNTVYAEGVHCSGINACKGTGACAGAGNECAGKNACKGLGVTETASADECAAQGGTVAE